MQTQHISRLISKVSDVKPEEIKALLLSWLYFFLLLTAYYIFRPIRNDMIIRNGVDNIQWLLLAAMLTMVAMTPLFGWLTSRFKIKQFLVSCTLFFASNLVVFYFLLSDSEPTIWVIRGFYIWGNVFALFVVSLFWSYMNDLFSQEQSKRLFAFISAGGTAGALCGPLITTLLVDKIGLATLLLVSAFLLSLTAIFIQQLSHHKPSNNSPNDQPQHHSTELSNTRLKGGIWDGVKQVLQSRYLSAICLFILLFTFIATYIAIGQISYIEATMPDAAARTKLFSKIDFATSLLTLFLQLVVTSKLIKYLGFRTTLCLIPAGLSIGVVILAITPAFWLLVCLQVFRRSGEYAIMKPTREMLFTILPREQKYKAKNFIDTVIFRTGDTISASIYNGVKAVSSNGYALVILGISAALAWCYSAWYLGNQYSQISSKGKSLKTELS